MPRRPSESQDKFIIRLPDGMREQIKSAAEANARTMTAEVVHRLAQSFDVERDRPAGFKFLATAKERAAKAKATTRDPLQEILLRLDAIERHLGVQDTDA